MDHTVPIVPVPCHSAAYPLIPVGRHKCFRRTPLSAICNRPHDAVCARVHQAPPSQTYFRRASLPFYRAALEIESLSKNTCRNVISRRGTRSIACSENTRATLFIYILTAIRNATHLQRLSAISKDRFTSNRSSVTGPRCKSATGISWLVPPELNFDICLYP